MSELRTQPLSPQDIERFNNEGYIFPNKVLSEDQVSMVLGAIAEHRAGRFGPSTHELTDPIRIREDVDPEGKQTFEYQGDNLADDGTVFTFLVNMRMRDERIRAIAADPVIAGMARQLLDAEEVVMFEDNALVKEPGSKLLPWHQDYSYWPLATPDAVTVFIALDNITVDNGAMMVVPGSQDFGEEYLPVAFGDVSSFMGEYRPGVREIPADPAAEGHTVRHIELKPGECSIHSSMIWHGSTSNATESRRHALILRYVKSGTIWLGNERMPYEETHCPVGAPIGGPMFPVIPTAF
jgi:ectoine hydroxylase-related dioxygenase (phytanoyl-CoA dioxygenase family)